MRQAFRSPYFLLSLLLLLAMCIFIITRIMPYASVLWDEGEFLLQTYWTVKPIQLHQWNALATQLYGQIGYAAFQYAILAPILAAIGFSIEKARIVQMLFLIITGISMYILSVQIGQSLFPSKKQIPKIIGLLSVFLFVTSPILIYLHTVILKESMVITLTIIGILSYLAARSTRKLRWYCIAGVMTALSFLTKYPYGIMNLTVFGIEGCIALFSAKKKQQRINVITSHLLIVLPVFLAAFLWVGTSITRFSQFTYTILNQEIPNLMLGWDLPTYIFFYPKSIAYMYGITIPVGIILIASLILGIQYIRTLGPRLLWLSVVTYFIFLTPHMNNVQARYIAPVGPLVLILASIVLVDTVRRSLSSPLLIRSIIWILVVSLSIHVILNLSNLPTRVYDVGTKTIYAIAFNQLDVNTTWFDYNTATWGVLSPLFQKKIPKMSLIGYLTGLMSPKR